MMPSRRKLIVLAKAPIAGHAKSRMIPRLGAAGAAQLHRQLTRWMLQRLVNHHDYETELWCASDIDHPFFQACSREFGVRLHLQQGDDLGERQYDALHSTLDECDYVVAIGSDVASLSAEDIRHAFRMLAAGRELVIAPAEDGGYGLIGASVIDREIFSEIPWGSERVYVEMKKRLNRLGIDWHALPQVWDLDRPADLHRLAEHPELSEALAELLA